MPKEMRASGRSGKQSFPEVLRDAERDLFSSGDQSGELFASLRRLFSSYMQFDRKTSFMGVYLNHKNVLVLGPFVGPPTIHDLIPISRGVVGRCADIGETIVVADVTNCEYYLSCCEEVRSEIVIPLVKDQTVVGVLDLDSPVVNAYTKKDLEQLDRVAQLTTHSAAVLADRLQLRAHW